MKRKHGLPRCRWESNFEIFHNKTNKCNNVTIMFLHTKCHNSDVFRFTLIIFREIINIDKTYVKTWTD